MRTRRAGIALLFVSLQSRADLRSQIGPQVGAVQKTGPMISWTGIGAGRGGAMPEVAIDPLTAEVFLGTNKGVFSLNVNGPDASWVDKNGGLPVDWMESLCQDTWYAISPLALVRPDSSTRVMYVAADTVFKSMDGGSTWEMCNSGDLPLATNDRLEFRNVMVHPTDPDVALLAAGINQPSPRPGSLFPRVGSAWQPRSAQETEDRSGVDTRTTHPPS